MPDRSQPLAAFQLNVKDKYTIFNSLFAALPFSGVANVGAFLPILLQHCESGYAAGLRPAEILEKFFETHTQSRTTEEMNNHLFKFVQYIERQVVLFDAIEDAAFGKLHHVQGKGSLKALYNEAYFQNKLPALRTALQDFRIRVVLTAHPTQFYPGNVLGILHDLGEALVKNDFSTINSYIQQLGITPFFNKKQPTPLDEANNLMWYLENVLYQSMGNIYNFIADEVLEGDVPAHNPFVELGFWPGGDRDGNPFVTSTITLAVAQSLRSAIMVCYYRDVRKLKRRITFAQVDQVLAQLEKKLYENVFRPTESKQIDQKELLDTLDGLIQEITQHHHGLFVDRVKGLRNKVKLFGTWFAALDIRQDSRVHAKALQQINAEQIAQGKVGILPKHYESWSEEEKITHLLTLDKACDTPQSIEAKDAIESLYAMHAIQQTNGEKGCHRYIISNCQSALQVVEVMALFVLAGWPKDKISADILPLFETVQDLDAAAASMAKLYALPAYRQHLQQRLLSQTIMLGFSDGTKDGSYLQANWKIFTAKEKLTQLSRTQGIQVSFFDGRGGPPSRGGGKTHQFYASQGNSIENKDIQLTIQGQTITSNFGNQAMAQYNLEQLLSAGLSSRIFPEKQKPLTVAQSALMAALGQISYETYQNFKADPGFLPYLSTCSPLPYYTKSNIASRPGKRGNGQSLKFEDLRAIPFVGSWSQLKQNVPGFYGLGTALETLVKQGKGEALQALYKDSLFFRTLLENSMMSMLKSFFGLTAHLAHDPEFGGIWQKIENEFVRSRDQVLWLSGQTELMGEDPISRASILLRDRIVLPLLTIQQTALEKLRQAQLSEKERTQLEKLVTRSMFGIINAARNSA